MTPNLRRTLNVSDVTRGRLAVVLELGNHLLIGIALASVIFLAVYFSILALLPVAWQTPGSPLLYVFGVVGAVLLLVSVVFVLVKRTGHGGAPPAWFAAHVVAAILGMVLVAIHSAGSLNRPPALMFIALIGLSVVGVWARTQVSSQMSATFGTRYKNFGAADPVRRERLREILSRKRNLLLRLDPRASEGTFSLRMDHWYSKPWLAVPYARLVREENRLVGARHTLPPVQAYWRWVHIVLGLVFMIGLISHVFTVTFLAEYVAEGRDITWPHISW